MLKKIKGVWFAVLGILPAYGGYLGTQNGGNEVLQSSKRLKVLNLHFALCV